MVSTSRFRVWDTFGAIFGFQADFHPSISYLTQNSIENDFFLNPSILYIFGKVSTLRFSDLDPFGAIFGFRAHFHPSISYLSQNCMLNQIV